jgi:hypothetical protein
VARWISDRVNLPINPGDEMAVVATAV